MAEIIRILAVLCFLGASFSEAQDFNPGSSLENEADSDWSEDDNSPGGDAGSSFEKSAQDYPKGRVWFDNDDVYLTPPEEDIVIVDPPDSYIVADPEIAAPLFGDLNAGPRAGPSQTTPEAFEFTTSPSPQPTPEGDVEVIYGGTGAE